MSRTYRKYVKCGICNGSNTEYYRAMNRKCRSKNNQELRNLFAHNSIDDIDSMIINHVPIHDDLDEPTDGTFLIGKNSKKRYPANETCYGSNETLLHWWNRKFGKYLKDKHFKH